MRSVQGKRQGNKGEGDRDERDVLKAAADRFFEEADRDRQRGEKKKRMKTKGVYVPAHWVKRWDPIVAMYLGYFVSYVGEQAREDGYIWDSAREVEDKTGIKPGRQERARNILEKDGVIFTGHGGIGGVKSVWWLSVTLGAS